MIPMFFFFLLHGPVQAAPTFSSINETILKASCVGCHGGAEPKGKIDLTSYDKVIASGTVTKFKPMESKLFLAVDSADMPPEGPALGSAQLDELYIWIKEGANDN